MAQNDNRPRGRERGPVSSGNGVNRRGAGLGTGPVGSGRRPSGGAGSSSHGAGSGGAGRPPGRPAGGSGGRSGGFGFSGMPLIVVIIIALLGGGGGALSTFLSDGSLDGGSGANWAIESDYTQSSGDSDFNHMNGLFGGNGSLSTGWTGSDTSQGVLNTEVAAGSREKYTTIAGNGRDTVTIMVYMCGTDLESKNGMATGDLSEMANATIGDNVNLLVYTGGCANWRNNIVSNKANQIYQVVSGGLRCLNSNAGTASMTNPATLSSYIRWCADQYPADRYELILWDHGGGSVSGYGYDELNKSSGAMSLAKINEALENGGVKFDMIGFDACLMATMENALMLGNHADYLVASEETEPGVGWYYTDWLTDLSANTSMPTVELGKEIADSFVATCNRKCAGQKTTLSVVDLAELAATAPDTLSKFAVSIRNYMKEKEYTTVSNARNQTREFAQSSRIDQVDLVNFAENLGNAEGTSLAKVVRSAVKYNRTSSNMTNAYGLAIYFPMRNMKYVDSMSATYDAIDMDDEYTRCIREFASLQASGQAVSGASGSATGSLFGNYAGSYAGLSSSDSAELVGQLLSAFLGGDRSAVSGLTEENSSFVTDSALSEEDLRAYLEKNRFDASQLGWVMEDGAEKIKLSEEQWAKVADLELNLFYDVGTGYVDLGLDNVYKWDDKGNLVADDGTAWISINWQPVAYYHIDTVDDGTNYTISGRVPCELNGDRAELILIFDNEHPQGYIAGAVYDYSEDDDIETIAKNMTALTAGDTLDFFCDYYSYDGTYQDTYYLGDTMTVTDDMIVGDTYVGGTTLVTYKFTDGYGASYWTESLKRN